MNIENILKPETPLERSLLADPEFVEGLKYGKPRRGHPEGEVIYHIAEVLKNVNIFNIGREKLRLIALIHDTFKYKVRRNETATGENHHAMIARRFAERYIQDPDVLDVIELHDEAYNSWGIGDRSGNWGKAEDRARRLIKRLGSNIELYMDFYYCDNNTGDKSQENYNWFENLVDAGA